jgi:DNA-3-methyladenine glycosylase
VGRPFFDRATVRVARDLLGAVVTVRGPEGPRSVRLVEVEAYVAHDPANHAYRGLTPRNRSMFGPPGTVYIYRIHQVVCANLVTRPGEAVLLRAGAPLRPPDANPSGPGRLCRVLRLTIADDGLRVRPGGRLAVRRPERPLPPGAVVCGPRVGISRATERRLRFSVVGDRWVSEPRPRPT